MRRELDLINENLDQFSEDFIEWLPDNLHVWDAFVVEGFKVIGLGFSHYSSKTIIHFLRHHSTIKASGDWKLNNNHSPYFSRLFDLCYPHLAGLWEYRTTTKTRRFIPKEIV